MTNTLPQPLTLLDLQGVKNKICMGKSFIYNSIESGSFPRPILLSKRAARWLEHEVDAWIIKHLPNQQNQPMPASSHDAVQDT